MKFKIIFSFFMMIISYTTFSQGFILVEGPEGSKRIYIDTTEACNPHRVYAFTEVPPHYEGGNDALEARLDSITHFDKNVEGKIWFWFTITCEGKAYGYQVIHGISPEVDQAMENALKQLGPWHPGMQNGKVTDVNHSLVMEIKRGKIRVVKKWP